ncbi:MAG: hypothetical protein PCFJNLEI_03601 [Verrucomicrobiae bacterium]|nr:hypothetical protein [Verrucomicrobiae bacterium]
MESDGEVVAGNTETGGNNFRGLALQVNLANQRGVLRFQGRNQPVEATAHDAFFFRRGCGGEFDFQGRRAAFPHVLPAIEINQSATQDAIEPSFRILNRPGLFPGLQRLEQTVLHHVGGQFGVADALTREGDELCQVLDQFVFQCAHLPLLTQMWIGYYTE